MSTANPARKTRRAVLGAAVGAAAASAVSALGVPRPVEAASNGSAVVIGGSYPDAQYETYIKNTSTVGGSNEYNRALHVESTVGVGVFATGPVGVLASGTEQGVYGVNSTAGGQAIVALQGDGGYPAPPSGAAGVTAVTWMDPGGAGVRGFAMGGAASTSGVYGVSDSTSIGYGVYGVATATNTTTQGVGVYGQAKSAHGGVGIYGYADSALGTTYGAIGHALSKAGVGVYGYTPGGGTAVRATSVGGLALETTGRVLVHKVSGVATIAAGTSSTTVKPGVAVATTAFVLLTPRGNLGTRSMWSTVAAGSAGTFTIHVSSAVTVATQVGWLLLG